jgi:hypothetical protein
VSLVKEFGFSDGKASFQPTRRWKKRKKEQASYVLKRPFKKRHSTTQLRQVLFAVSTSHTASFLPATTPLMPRDAAAKRKPLLSKLLSRFRGRHDAALLNGKALGSPPGDGDAKRKEAITGKDEEAPDTLSPVPHTPAEEASSLSDRPPSTLSRQRSSLGSSVDGASPDASVRPISPSSLAASSVASTPRTFKSTVSASTKPTTLFSVASDGGANRIAVSPSVRSRQDSSHARSPSLDSPRFNQSLYASPNGNGNGNGNGGGRPQSERTVSSEKGVPGMTAAVTFSHLPGATIPNHSHPHPRNNPHPSSPPPDNASTLTLASSTFAHHSSAFSAHQPVDEDASTRALAPSRRASQDSLGWSRRTASIRTTNTAGTGAAALEPGRAAITPSMRTDGDDDVSVVTAPTTPACEPAEVDSDDRDESALATEEAAGEANGEAKLEPEPETPPPAAVAEDEGETTEVPTPTKDGSDDQLDRPTPAVAVQV